MEMHFFLIDKNAHVQVHMDFVPFFLLPLLDVASSSSFILFFFLGPGRDSFFVFLLFIFYFV